MKTTLGALAAGLVLAAGTANAAISFSFADPGATSGEMRNTRNDSTGGTVTYNMNAPLAFIVDLTQHGGGVTVFGDARLELNLTIGLATGVGPGTYSASVTGGSFRVYNNVSGQDILLAAVAGGSIVTYAPGGSLGSTTSLGLTYTAGSELTTLINALGAGLSIGAPSDGVFTLTDINPVQNLVEDLGQGSYVYNNFAANASFSGTTALIPTPGSLALLGLGGLVAGRRRR